MASIGIQDNLKSISSTTHPLSQREEEIVKLIVTGYSSREMAEKLFISAETVKTHRKNIHKKLQTKSVVQVILKVEQLQLV